MFFNLFDRVIVERLGGLAHHFADACGAGGDAQAAAEAAAFVVYGFAVLHSYRAELAARGAYAAGRAFFELFLFAYKAAALDHRDAVFHFQEHRHAAAVIAIAQHVHFSARRGRNAHNLMNQPEVLAFFQFGQHLAGRHKAGVRVFGDAVVQRRDFRNQHAGVARHPVGRFPEGFA